MYDLQVEPRTAYGRWAEAGKLAGLPSEEMAAEMYRHAVDVLSGPTQHLHAHHNEGTEQRGGGAPVLEHEVQETQSPTEQSISTGGALSP